jgi:hypothetical protein
MNRREFLATGLAGVAVTEVTGDSPAAGGTSGRQFYEWRQYHLRTGSNKNRVGDFLREVGIPGLNRAGIKPVGVFNPLFGPSNAKLYVLLVHESLDSVLTGSARLLQDAEVRQKGASFLDATLAEPAYVRFESSLLAAFTHMPRLEVPTFKERIFELRIYESHSAQAARKKVEMFNEGGEIEIFRKTGLNPVFFGATMIGPDLPNLNYMLAFQDMADRDKRWQVFRDDPDWQKLSRDPAYKDTVSNITDIILKPADYSQI